MLAFVSLPFTFQSIMGFAPAEVGMLMMPWPLATGVAAPLAGRLSDRYSPAILGGIGLAALAAGLAALALLPAHPQIPDIAWRMALCGAGFGFFQTPNNRTLITSAPKARSGSASGMLGTARLTGQTIGAALAALMHGADRHHRRDHRARRRRGLRRAGRGDQPCRGSGFSGRTRRSSSGFLPLVRRKGEWLFQRTDPGALCPTSRAPLLPFPST